MAVPKDVSIDKRVGTYCNVFGQANQGLTVGFLLLHYSVVYMYMLFIPYLSLASFCILMCMYIWDDASIR